MENENSYSRNIHSCEMNIKTCKIVNPWCPLGIGFPKMIVMLLLMKYNDLSTYTQKGKKIILHKKHVICVVQLLGYTHETKMARIICQQ
jgi:hypothetical protein